MSENEIRCRYERTTKKRENAEVSEKLKAYQRVLYE